MFVAGALASSLPVREDLRPGVVVDLRVRGAGLIREHLSLIVRVDQPPAQLSADTGFAMRKELTALREPSPPPDSNRGGPSLPSSSCRYLQTSAPLQ